MGDLLTSESFMNCVDRALNTAKELGWGLDKMDIVLYLDFAHQDTPLDFDKLFSFDKFNFLHDVGGIINNMNHETKTIDNCFLPRCAA